METMKDDREVSNRGLHTRKTQLGRDKNANKNLCPQLGTGVSHSHSRLYSQAGIDNSGSDPAAELEVRA